MKSIILIIVFVFSSMNMLAQKVKVPIDENPRKVIGTDIPYSLVRMNVEAWLEDNILTIQFYQSEGDVTITLNCGDGNDPVEFTFSSDIPIIIDITPYGDVFSFNIKTAIGKNYMGHL